MVEGIVERIRARFAIERDAFTLLLSIGALVCIIVWADVLGHGFGLEASAAVVQQIENPRVFFLVGFTCGALGSILVAPFEARFKTRLRWLALFCSVLGTVLYGSCAAVAYGLEMGVSGLFLCGVGYYVVTLLTYCELAKVTRISSAVAAIAAALFFKTLFASQVSMALHPETQLAVACVLPIASYACLTRLCHCDAEVLESYRSRTTLSKVGTYDLLFLLVAVALMLAALRGASHLGLWGEGYGGSPVSSVAGYATVGVALAAFMYLTLVRNSNNQMLVRFQPAFLVLAAGFVIYVLQDEFFVVSESLQLFDWLYLTVELFGHLLSGTLIITAIRTTDGPMWRFQGASDFAFGLVAIPWIFIAQNPTVDFRPIMVVAIFLAMVAAIRPMSTRPLEIEHSLDAVAVGSVSEEPGDSPSSSEAIGAADSKFSCRGSEGIGRRLAEYHQEIANSHGLSARETDVFLLLAQGRSRPYICEAFYLSDGTVKTHISHIYRKFDVHSRQELLDAVQEEVGRIDQRACGEHRTIS